MTPYDQDVLIRLCSQCGGAGVQARDLVVEGEHVLNVVGALGRLEDEQLVEAVAGNGMPRGSSNGRRWRPTDKGRRVSVRSRPYRH